MLVARVKKNIYNLIFFNKNHIYKTKCDVILTVHRR